MNLIYYSYAAKRERIRTSDTVYSFNCAQSKDRESKPKVQKNSEKSRSTLRMERFECDGWLHITAASDSAEMTIALRHDGPHAPYTEIELPDKWKKYIQENAMAQTPGQVRRVVQCTTRYIMTECSPRFGDTFSLRRARGSRPRT